MKDQVEHALEMEITGGKADRDHAMRQYMTTENFDYWWKERCKAVVRINKAEYRLKRYRAGQGFNIGNYVLGLVTLAQ